MKKILIITILLVLSSTTAFCREIELPWSATLDTEGDYSDIVWYQPLDGSAFEHRTTGCWSGGCGRWTPPSSETTTGDMGRRAGIYNLSLADNTTTFHIRWLFRHSANWEEEVESRGYGTQDKWLIVLTTAGTNNRFMSIYEQCRSAANCIPAGADYFSPGVCGTTDDNGCYYVDNLGTNQPQAGDDYRSENYEEEWVCFEYAVDLTAQTSTLYIWTQDEVYNGVYIGPISTTHIGGAAYAIEGLGHYFNGYYPSEDGVWFEIDEIAIDDEYIGPPSGFVGGAESSIQGIKIK